MKWKGRRESGNLEDRREMSGGKVVAGGGIYWCFAVVYVVAHEIGHHVQALLGTFGKVRQMQKGMSQSEANKLSVTLELQADFYAGVWAHHNEKMNQMLKFTYNIFTI